MGKHSMHGMRYETEYTIWSGIKRRCCNINDEAYPRYGGRGITVCEKWLVFDGFFEDMGNRPSKNHSLERVDNNRGYCKDNCKWATYTEQGRNKRNNVRITWDGKTQSVIEWAQELGISANALYMRKNRLGWSDARTMSQPFKGRTVKLKEVDDAKGNNQGE